MSTVSYILTFIFTYIYKTNTTHIHKHAEIHQKFSLTREPVNFETTSGYSSLLTNSSLPHTFTFTHTSTPFTLPPLPISTLCSFSFNPTFQLRHALTSTHTATTLDPACLPSLSFIWSGFPFLLPLLRDSDTLHMLSTPF